jgi:hypothetical protein
MTDIQIALIIVTAIVLLAVIFRNVGHNTKTK